MLKRPLRLLLCTALLFDLTGCTRRHLQTTTPDSVPTLTNEWIVAVTTKSGEVVEFDDTIIDSWGGEFPDKPYSVVRNDTLFAMVSKAPYRIALPDVQHLWIKVPKVDPALTALAVVAGVAAVSVVLLWVAVAGLDNDTSGSSCPFVYSWDGRQYVFDAEPYAGAITRGLERDDFSELENLQAADGSYRLLLVNEMPETDCTNSVELWIVDHPPGQRVAADALGRVHDITGAMPPLAVTDESGRDLHAWLAAADRLVWEPPPEESADGDVRTDIVMTFPRPAGSEQSNLVANVQTGTWGAWMIRELLGLRGNQLTWFYAAVDGIPAAQESLRTWNEREELFLLKVEVEEEDGWHVRGFLPGGARAPENMVVPLDTHRVQGDTLRLRIRPPVGFWALNSFAMDYSVEPALDVCVVSPTSATDRKGNDVLPHLLAALSSFGRFRRMCSSLMRAIAFAGLRLMRRAHCCKALDGKTGGGIWHFGDLFETHRIRLVIGGKVQQIIATAVEENAPRGPRGQIGCREQDVRPIPGLRHDVIDVVRHDRKPITTQGRVFLTSNGGKLPTSLALAVFEERPMLKRALILLLCTALLFDLTSCTRRHLQTTTPDSVPTLTDEWIVAVTTKDGEVLEFDVTTIKGAWSGRFPDKPLSSIRNDTLFAVVNEAPYSIALADVQHLWIKVEKVDPVVTVVGAVGIAVFVSLMVLGITAVADEDEPQSNSCPFVYSWDGEQYVFDAEPYAGAITRGLERDDFAELENLRAADGSYRLLLVNEMPETDCTNSVELWIVDHPPGQRVAADAFGRIHDITGAMPPLAVTDESGRDLHAWLAATDRLVWEPAPEETSDGDVRTEIVMTFPRPAGSEQANLVANVQTGTWGAWMIRELLDLRGNQLPWFYAAVDGVPAAQESLRTWNEREELFLLKVEVEEADGWQVRGFLPGGARAPENMVVPLDIHRVQGDTLRLRIRPPVGFWALNSFAMDYSVEQPLEVRFVSPTSATDRKGNDVLQQLLATDDVYHVMPETGWAQIVFPAPHLARGTTWSIFLHSRGYYRLHLPADRDPDAVRLEQIANEPDAATRFAVERFAEWRTARAKQREPAMVR